MKILALAVLLTVVQASPPAPRQATSSSAGASEKVQSDAARDQAPSAKPPSPVNPAPTPPNEGYAKRKAQDDTQKTVRITEPITVSVSPSKRGWMENGAWVFNLLLVVTSGLQVWLLCRTLKYIRIQAREAKRQRGFMRLQWKEMTKQATHMEGQLSEMEQSREIQTKILILQYRPRVIVRDAKAADFNVAELGKPSQAKVTFTLVNTGGTAARVTGGTVAIWSVEGTRSPAPIEFKRGEDDLIDECTLQPGEGRVVEKILNAGVTNDIQWANYHQALQTEPSRYIYLLGMIRYIDELGIPRRTGIGRRYDPKSRTFLAGTTSDEEYTD